MPTIEISAKSIDDATQQAAKQLGVAPDQLTVRVLEQSKGLFGRGSVRIAATADVAAAAPVEAAPIEATPAPAATPVVPSEPEPVAAPVAVAEPEPEPVVAVEAADAAPVSEERSEVVATEEDGKFLYETMLGLIKAADLQVNAHLRGLNGKYVEIELDGKDASFLVGKHGEVINALQYLMNVISNQRLGSGVRVTLDCNHYRERREAALVQMAQNIAAQVRERGEEAVLDALPAFERRIVHKALSETEGISTYSEGEEPNRRVVIAPAD